MVAYAEARGFICPKFAAPGRRGVPDRVFVRGGRVWFVEFKRAGERPRAQQRAVFAEFAARGCPVVVLDSVQGGRAFVDACGPAYLSGARRRVDTDPVVVRVVA